MRRVGLQCTNFSLFSKLAGLLAWEWELPHRQSSICPSYQIVSSHYHRGILRTDRLRSDRQYWAIVRLAVLQYLRTLASLYFWVSYCRCHWCYCRTCKPWSGIMISRGFCGIGAGSNAATGAATICDLFFSHERGIHRESTPTFLLVNLILFTCTRIYCVVFGLAAVLFAPGNIPSDSSLLFHDSLTKHYR